MCLTVSLFQKKNVLQKQRVGKKRWETFICYDYVQKCAFCYFSVMQYSVSNILSCLFKHEDIAQGCLFLNSEK